MFCQVYGTGDRPLSPLSFVLELHSQDSCKIDELVHRLLLGGCWSRGVEFLCEAIQLESTSIHAYQVLGDEFVLKILT